MKKVVELNVNLVMFLDYCVNITLMYIFFMGTYYNSNGVPLA